MLNFLAMAALVDVAKGLPGYFCSFYDFRIKA